MIPALSSEEEYFCVVFCFSSISYVNDEDRKIIGVNESIAKRGYEKHRGCPQKNKIMTLQGTLVNTLNVQRSDGSHRAPA